MRMLCVVLVVAGLAGCDAPAKTATSGKPAAPSGKPAREPLKELPSKEIKIDPAAYATVDEAIAAMCQAAEKADSPTRLAATGWLALQGEAAVKPLSEILADSSRSVAARIAVCRALGQLGTPGVAPLKAAVDDEVQLVRINAAEQLAMIKPISKESIATMVRLLDDKDNRLRVQALKGIAHIGPPAKDVVPKLVSILNSNDNETVRDAAKAALLKVNPRHSFVD